VSTPFLLLKNISSDLDAHVTYATWMFIVLILSARTVRRNVMKMTRTARRSVTESTRAAPGARV
jgi:hypothetical protein